MVLGSLQLVSVSQNRLGLISIYGMFCFQLQLASANRTLMEWSSALARSLVKGNCKEEPAIP